MLIRSLIREQRVYELRNMQKLLCAFSKSSPISNFCIKIAFANKTK